MIIEPLYMLRPFQADGLFPKVCVDQEYIYPKGTTTLQALRDAERAFQLYATCRYLLPENFAMGIRKISDIVGCEVSAENVKELQRSRMPDPNASIPERTFVSKIISALHL